MKVSLLSSTSIALLSFLSLAKAETKDQDIDKTQPFVSNDFYKFKPNPLGNVIPGRFIIEFEDDFRGTSEDFVYDVESDIKKMQNGINSHIKLAIAQDFKSSPSIFRGVSIALYEEYVSPLNKRESDSKANRMQLIENTVLGKLLQENRVKHVYPVTEIPRPKVNVGATVTENNDTILSAPKLDIPYDGPHLPFTHTMTQVDRVHSNLNLTGKGILVGIIDSGVDYRHPAFGSGFGPGFPVRFGYDLVGDHFNSRDPFSREVQETPLDSCQNSNGHGTHVAGIIAANDKLYVGTQNFTGVAPEVTLGAWRVFSCEGSSSNDVFIQALLSAHEAGCDIINLSLGTSSNWANDPSAIVADRVTKQGSLVISAAGNDGNEGAFYISSPSTGQNTISVASIDNIFNLQRVIFTENERSYPYLLSSTTNAFPSGKVVNYANSTSDMDACFGSDPDNDIQGKIALIRRGTCTFDDKAAMAKKFGAIGVLLYDNRKKSTLKPQASRSSIPFAAINLDAGEELKELINSQYKEDGIYVEFRKTLTRQNVSSGYGVSEFSSVGPLYDMNLKPDIAGPGGYIFSTLPIANGGYGMLSGTSMSTPYLAGAYALYLQKHGENYNPQYLKEHFQNYAKPSSFMDKYIDNPSRQGAGLVQVLDAIDQVVHVSPGSISFNDTTNMKQQTLKVINPSNDVVKYKLSNLQSVPISPYNTILQGYAPLNPSLYDTSSSVAELNISPNNITLQPGETAEITVNITSISGNSKENPFPIYGGYIQLVPEDQELLKPIHVPYVGIKGSLSDLPIFDYRFPRIMLNDNVKTFEKHVGDKLMTGFVLDRSSRSSYYIDSAFRLLTGTPIIKTEVLDFNLSYIGTFAEDYYLARNTMSSKDYIFSQRWNGTIIAEEEQSLNQLIDLDPGVYFLRWKALKLMSEPSLPSSWESKLSPPVLINN